MRRGKDDFVTPEDNHRYCSVSIFVLYSVVFSSTKTGVTHIKILADEMSIYGRVDITLDTGNAVAWSDNEIADYSFTNSNANVSITTETAANSYDLYFCSKA